jgi:O-antigen ligase
MNRISPYAVLAWFSFGAFFLLGLVVNKIFNASFYLLLLLGTLYALKACKKKNTVLLQIWGQHIWVYIAATAMISALLIHDIVVGNAHIRAYDIPSCIALLGLLTFAAAAVPTNLAKKMRWLFMLGTLLATVKLAMHTGNGDYRVAVVGFISIIALTQLTLLLSVFVVFSIIWCEKRNSITLVLAALTATTGLYSVYISQTRGAWIAIPLFIVLMCIVFLNNGGVLKKLSGALLLIVVIGGFFSTTSIVRNRIEQAISDIQQYENKGNTDTSLGTRLQLWRASWHIFVEHPVLGVGGDNFKSALKNLADRGVITRDAATYPHSHNEILFSMATYGVFGLLGMLAIYFVPLYHFIGAMRHTDRDIVAAAAMGVALCLGYMIFGLVDVMFMWRICNIFYVMSMAFFLGFIIRKKYELRSINTDVSAL